jgi:uncharacterized protein YcbX
MTPEADEAGTLAVTLAGLNIYPVKSGGGLPVRSARLDATGLEFDRWWMVVDPAGQAVTQRELPRMALIQPTLRLDTVQLRAPGMLALHLALDAAEHDVQVQLWGQSVPALDMGDLAAQWLSDCLGRPLRLARFDPEHDRLSDTAWTGAVRALNAFSDGFPLLLVSQASLTALNERLAERGSEPVDMRRFRANLVIDGLAAHEEDHVAEFVFEGRHGPIRLRPVKPCPRCTIPGVDPDRGEQGHEPSDTLATYRADRRLDGAISFGMNAVIVEGFDDTLDVGMPGRARLAFD